MAKMFGKITIIKKNGRDGTKVPLLDNLCTIGRDSECDIRIKLPTVSSKHCQLEVVDGKVVFTNLSGTNPSLVNDVAVVDKTFLNDEDIFTVTTRSFRWDACKPEDNDVEMSNKEQENQHGSESARKRVMRSSTSSVTKVHGPTPVKTPKVALNRSSARKSSGIMKTPLSIKKSTRASFAKTPSSNKNVEKIISSPDRMKTAALRSIHAAQLKYKNSPELSKQGKSESSPPVSPNISTPGSLEKQKTPGKVDADDSSFDFSTHKTPSVPTEMFVSPLQTPVAKNKNDSDTNGVTLNGDSPLETSNRTKSVEKTVPTSSRKSSKAAKAAVKRRSSRKADYTDVTGVKRLMKQSPVADYGNVSGLQNLMATPEAGDSADVSVRRDEPSVTKSVTRSGNKRKSSLLKNQDLSLAGSEEVETTETAVKRRSSPKGDYTNVIGVKRLMGKSPVPDYSNVSGVQALMASPEVSSKLTGRGDEPSTPKSSSKRKLISPSVADIGEVPETPAREAQVVLARISPQVIKQYSPRSPNEQLTSEENVLPATVIDESTNLELEKTQSPVVSINRKSSLTKSMEKYQPRKSQEATAQIILSPVKMTPRRSVLTEKSSRGSTPRMVNGSPSLSAKKYVLPVKVATPNKTPEILNSSKADDVEAEEVEETATPKRRKKSTPGSGRVTVRTLRTRTVSSVTKRGTVTGPKRGNVLPKKGKKEKVAMLKLTYSQDEEVEDRAVDVAEGAKSNGEVEVAEDVPVISPKKKTAVKSRQTRSRKLADIDMSEFNEKSEVDEDAASVVSSRMDDEDNVSEASSVVTTKRKRIVRGKKETVETSNTSPLEKAVVGRPRRLASKKLEVLQAEVQGNEEPGDELQSGRKTRLRKDKSPSLSNTAVKKLLTRTRASRTPTARRSNSKSPGIRMTRSRKQMAANH